MININVLWYKTLEMSCFYLELYTYKVYVLFYFTTYYKNLFPEVLQFLSPPAV